MTVVRVTFVTRNGLLEPGTVQFRSNEPKFIANLADTRSAFLWRGRARRADYEARAAP
jgi:hypothetical protein